MLITFLRIIMMMIMMVISHNDTKRLPLSDDNNDIRNGEAGICWF
jgi:hypothetical protein